MEFPPAPLDFCLIFHTKSSATFVLSHSSYSKREPDSNITVSIIKQTLEAKSSTSKSQYVFISGNGHQSRKISVEELPFCCKVQGDEFLLILINMLLDIILRGES